MSEERFRHLFGRAPIALAITHRDGRVLLLNQAFEALFGYRQDELPTVEVFRERIYPDPALRARQERHWQESWHGAFDEAPLAGTWITASFEFDCVCRFNVDKLGVSILSPNLLDCDSIEVIEVRT